MAMRSVPPRPRSCNTMPMDARLEDAEVITNSPGFSHAPYCRDTALNDSVRSLPSGKDNRNGPQGRMPLSADKLNFTMSSMDILVVDDDEETRRHVTAGLSSAGHQVTEAADATSALN